MPKANVRSATKPPAAPKTTAGPKTIPAADSPAGRKATADPKTPAGDSTGGKATGTREPGTPRGAVAGTGRRSRLLLLGLCLAWLVALLFSAHTSVLHAGDPVIAVIDAALALPGVIAASLLAGAAGGLVARGWAGAGRHPVLRFSSAPGGGLVIGLLTAGLMLLGYGHRPSIMLLAGSVAVAGLVGGAIGGIRPGQVVAAGLSATLAAFVVDFVLTLYQSRLMSLLGAGSAASSQVSAATRVALVEALLGGLVAGIVAYRYLRRRSDRRFPAYLLAGAVPGVLLLLAEIITRVGGAQLFRVVSADSAADRVVLDYLATSRLDHGIVVLFTGAIVALVALGRTLRPGRR